MSYAIRKIKNELFERIIEKQQKIRDEAQELKEIIKEAIDSSTNKTTKWMSDITIEYENALDRIKEQAHKEGYEEGFEDKQVKEEEIKCFVQ